MSLLDLSALDALGIDDPAPAASSDAAVSTPQHGTEGTFSGGVLVVVFLEVQRLQNLGRWASLC